MTIRVDAVRTYRLRVALGLALASVALWLAGCASESRGATVDADAERGFSITRDLPSAALRAPQINSQRGSIGLWVRPDADFSPDDSATFLSARWDSQTNSYLAISQGWWEPAGAGKLFVVVSNQARVHCKADHELLPGAWTHIVAVWESGAERTCQLYVDGRLLAASKQARLPKYSLSGPLTLGNDSAAERKVKRQFRGQIEVDFLSSSALAKTEIALRFEQGKTRFDSASLAENAWMPTSRSVVEGNERRVIFFETREWAESPQAVQRAVDRTVAGGFNVLIPCVWHGRGTRYPSSEARWEKELAHHSRSGFDPLDALFKAAHARGIEVHPWFTVVKREDDWRSEYAPRGTPQYAYDVHRPAFRDYIVDIIAEVIRKYPVDGINLDYIRSIGFCESETCKEEYRASSGHSLSVDLAKRRVSAAAAERLRQWNAAAVGDIIRRVDEVRRQERCEIPLTVDAHPSNKAIALQGQDSVAWVNQGWIDVIFAMDYDERPKFAQASKVIAELPDAEHFTLLFSNASRVARREWAPRQADQLAGFVEASRSRWPRSGSAFWHMPRFADATLRNLREQAYIGAPLPLWPDRAAVCAGVSSDRPSAPRGDAR